MLAHNKRTDTLSLKALQNFTHAYYPVFGTEAAGIESDPELHSLTGDAGFRRYYRADVVPPVITVESPPEKEKNLEYVRVNLLLENLGVRVPKIYAADFPRGYFLLEDLGKEHLLDQLRPGNAKDLYKLALEQLRAIQSCQNQPAYIPDYDRALLLAEMKLFPEWFLKGLLGISLDEKQLESLDALFEILVKEALSQPQVLVHRDYHARNLMCLETGELGVIDFQDAVWGPITYDLISLARDCYQRWSASRVEEFVESYADELLETGKIDSGQRASFRRWFDLMGLQRHIKVLGIFARLHLRDGKPGYLKDLPLVLRYTIEVLRQYQEFSDMVDWMLEGVIPFCTEQDWYSDWTQAGAASELA